jgi:AAA15 family ATPase/GTPase
MVTSVEIRNFRGFKKLAVDDLAPINIIVGDNGSGKTAFLETIYLAASGNAQQPFILKQWRGQEVKFLTGSVDSVVEAIYADLFHDSKSEEPITIKLVGRGFENRELLISRSNEVIIPLKGPNRQERRSAKKKPASFQTPIASKSTSVPISLVWTDEKGDSYTTRALLGSAGLSFEGTNERLPNSFLFASQAFVSATEAAGHYSALKKSRSSQKFRKIFLSVFDQITDIDAGDVGGNSTLLVDVPWSKELLPLPLFSGGTNRAAAILLSITHRQNGLVMVDEIENGIFHARQRKFSQALLELAREYKNQLIMTTHSEEWIQNFFEAADKKIDDVAFWRLERNKENVPTMRKFSLPEFRAGMAAGEMR